MVDTDMTIECGFRVLGMTVPRAAVTENMSTTMSLN